MKEEEDKKVRVLLSTTSCQARQWVPVKRTAEDMFVDMGDGGQVNFIINGNSF